MPFGYRYGADTFWHRRRDSGPISASLNRFGQGELASAAEVGSWAPPVPSMVNLWSVPFDRTRGVGRRSQRRGVDAKFGETDLSG